MSKPPFLFLWDAKDCVMRPHGALGRVAAGELYEPGCAYLLAEVADRSSQSHRHYFAAINEAWLNLPEQYVDEWWSKTAEALRKYALIETGYCDTSSFQFGDASSALAASIEFRQRDTCSMVLISARHLVTWCTAHSQAAGEMDGATFQKSKTAVLDYLASLLDISTATLIERGEGCGMTFHKLTKHAAWERAKGRCEGCGAILSYGGYEYDHIKGKWLGGDNSLDNCRVLCKPCHAKKTRKSDIPLFAKSNRLRLRAAGVRKDRTITAWRNFKEEIVRRPKKRERLK